MRKLWLKFKRWAAYIAARRFFLKQGYGEVKSDVLAKEVVKIKYGE